MSLKNQMPAPDDFLHFYEKDRSFTEADSVAPTQEINNEDYERLLVSNNRYTNKLLLNEGGFKKIFLCFDTFLKRRVVMAEMKVVLTNENVSNFLEEAYIMASISHSKIIPVLDIALSATLRPFYIMPLITGYDLNELIFNQKAHNHHLPKYSTDKLLDFFCELCQTVTHIHDQGILHLDLQPANFLITPSQSTSIIDFGNARRINKSVTWMDRISYKGTPGFTAPECMYLIDCPITSAADIYSLGACLFTILTKTNPNAGFPKDIEGINSKALVSIIQKASHNDPLKRFTSPQALAEAVQKSINNDLT